MTHLAPALEWLHKPAHRYRGAVPSELFQVLRQPDLKRLGFGRLDLRNHLAPAPIALDEFPADVGYGSKSDSQNHEIEIVAHPQRPRANFVPVPMRLEIPLLSRDTSAVNKL